ncbi:MAG: hypothetical protein P8M70_09120, partial [Verrucomicrobiota bacterium]|nr:hypothetical protein [Verrucomicrobiota bacterium]
MKKLIIALITILGIFTTDTAWADGGSHYKTIFQKGDGTNWVHADILVIPSGKCAEQVSIFSNNNSNNNYDWAFKISKDGVD